MAYDLRPFSESSADALASVQGVACDLDDTLTERGALTTESIDALHALRAAGIPCVVVTGRPLGWGEVLARMLPVRAVVTENGGAWVVRESDRVRAAFLEDADLRAEGMARVETVVREITAKLPELKRVMDLTQRATDVALDVHEAGDVPDDIVEKAVAMAHAARLCTVVSTVHLHVSARRPDKVAGMRAALEDLGLSSATLESRWIYVGDSPNDASAFEAVDLSVGVSSVRNFAGRMPAWPKYVTEGGPGFGFAEVVKRLLAHRATGWHRP